MEVNINKSYYNKTIIQEDGVTQIVDTKHKYELYHVSIEKNYFDVNKEQLIKNIINDLKEVEKAFENQLNKEQNKNNKKLEK